MSQSKILKMLLVITAVLAIWLISLSIYLAWQGQKMAQQKQTLPIINQPEIRKKDVPPAERLPERVPMYLP